MGARGPIPDREGNLARPRARKGGDEQEVTHGRLRPTNIPRADPEWHPIARKFWDGLKTSGQADFYQNSDWAFAYSLMDDLSYYKKSPKRSSQMLASIYTAMASLLATEGDRRRVRLELEAPEPDSKPAELVAIDGYKAKLLG
jgi:hypothetical protein